jgi:type VI secretion system protein ImpA
MELERLIPGKPEVESGSEKHPAEEPDWREVRDRSVELLGRTKDLRVALWLAVALLRLEGIAGLRDGLALFRGILERFWDGVHPQLDPEDDNDPIRRLNIISWLAPPGDVDEVKFRQRLREAPLCTSRQLQQSFSYRDVCIARGEIAPGETGDRPAIDQAVIDGAFEETTTEELLLTAGTLGEAREHARAIVSALEDKVGSKRAPGLSGFTAVLEKVAECVQTYLSRRGYVGDKQEGSEKAAAAKGRSAAPVAAGVPGQIRSPEDVLAAIERICEYYEKNEPSSPLPLLMRRAQRLVSKSFMEIVRDLSPDSVRQLDLIVGLHEDEQQKQ